MSMNVKSSKYEHIIYLSIWVAVFIISFVIVGDKIVAGDTHQWKVVWRILRESVPFFIAFIIHAYIIIPLFLEKHKYITYAVLLALMICIFGVNSYITHSRRHQEREKIEQFIDSSDKPIEIHGRRPPVMRIPPPVVVDLSLLVLLIGANLLVRLTFTRSERQKRMSVLKQEITKAELENLKSQVSPHFFMNVLNNIHGLIEIDQARAQEMVLELSNMMRYVLYDCASSLTTIQKEIGFIENYVKLMSARYPSTKLDIHLNLSNTLEYGSKKIPPLIFIVFIENAFKHGISFSQEEPAFIDIDFDIKDDALHFVCRNRINEITDRVRKPGIGLKNISRRLEVIYGKKYSLNIKNDTSIYNVDLKIPLEYEN